MSVAEKILEMGYEDIIIFDNPSYDSAKLYQSSRIRL